MTLNRIDFGTTTDSGFARDVLRGLQQTPKSLPCKYFYDAVGVELFDRICELEAYYPTRTELGIMRRHGAAMAGVLGARATLVELGSGSSTKTRILLDRARELAAYVPVDISPEYLARSRAALARDYPALPVLPVCADYTHPVRLPRGARGDGRTVVYFPGSTIGNFEPREAQRFLEMIARLAGRGGALLLGVDLKKDPRILHAAYNDPEGVTAAFNLNLLARINRELGADFDLRAFRHHAFYDAAAGRIEMQLVSAAAQTVRIAGARIVFAPGEAISTEYSYKYAPEEVRRLGERAGFALRTTWMDDEGLFSVHHLDVAEPGVA
jgi:dimethylhistidine N-methyltransferase